MPNTIKTQLLITYTSKRPTRTKYIHIIQIPVPVYVPVYVNTYIKFYLLSIKLNLLKNISKKYTVKTFNGPHAFNMQR